MKEIPLTQGKFALVDDEDYEYLSQWKWCAICRNGQYHAQRKDNKKSVYMHRIIMDAPLGMVVDHINGNPLDNQKKNLRICTQHQNTMNCKISSNNTSGFSGVHYCNQTNRWRATIMVNGKNVHLGRFFDLEDAVAARKEAEEKYFGEYKPSR